LRSAEHPWAASRFGRMTWSATSAATAAAG